MPRRDGYVPKHRGPLPEPTLKKGNRRSTVLLSGVALAVTGMAVSSCVLTQQDAVRDDAHAALRTAPHLDEATTAPLAQRERSTSRSEGRTSLDTKDAQNRADQDDEPAKKDDKKADNKQGANRDRSSRGQARQERLTNGNPRDIARALLPKYGFSADQFGCLDALYVSESNWNPRADNPTSSAYGIPQALTETHDLPADYMTNPATQIRWGLGYIRSSYGTPCGAWEFKQANNWY